jgi:hypothetical protein
VQNFSLFDATRAPLLMASMAMATAAEKRSLILLLFICSAAEQSSRK